MTNFPSRSLRNTILVSAVSILILACAAVAPTAVIAPTAVPILPVISTPTTVALYKQVSLTSTAAEEDSQSPNYKITTQTPSLIGSKDPGVKNFNAEMTALVNKSVADFKQNLAAGNLTPVPEGSSFDVQYKQVSPPGNTLSLKFEMEGYVSGAAHPYHFSQTVNYDLGEGRDITLSELFLPNSSYLETIAAFCVAQLKSRDIGFDSSITQGADPTPDNYRNWNITNDGLLITFDEYQVTAYAAGPQTVVVPYSELKALIDPQGPLRKFVK